jgi:putative transposase
VAGMQWLQSTFANRFDKLRDVHGHLFQGRYKSLLVEPGGALGLLCDYIHLNPVHAGVVEVSQLEDYQHSSYGSCSGQLCDPISSSLPAR